MSVSTAPALERETAVGAGLPRLLAGVQADAMTLAYHEAVHGPLPLVHRRRGETTPQALLEELERSGLRGRGGAGFPTAAKLRAVAAARGRACVLVNVGEAEPASRKDRTLTRALPHLVLDGGELVAATLGARELILAVCESAQSSADSLAMAIAERHSRGAMHARIVSVPERYVASQETALVSHVNGAPALPTFAPPRPFERGVAGRPTFVGNAETLAHLALIARHGANWFRALGTAADPGSALVTLSGPVARPGVYEIALGTPVSSLLDVAGGLTARAYGVLLGGYGGSWIAGEHLDDLLLADQALEPYGASMGAGVVLVLSEGSCPVAEVARLARWLASESAGQCGPCVHGLDAIADELDWIAGTGAARGEGATGRIAQLAALVRRRGACGHPDGTVRMVLSALAAFPAEFADHARHGACERCLTTSELKLPQR
jgi:NADH:ubiquinone oxidoreductase subunit F (NADH-binding)